MPIPVLLFLIAAVSPIQWPHPPQPFYDSRATLSATAGLVAVALLGSLLVSARVVRIVRRDPARRPAAALAYARWRRLAFPVNAGLTALAVYPFGWGWLVQHACRVPWNESAVLAPFAELLVPLPYLLVVLCNWAIYHPAERALADASDARGRAFWTLPGFVLFNARQFLVQVLLPVLLACGHGTATRFFPQAAGAWPFQLASVSGVALFALVLPRLLKPLLGLTSMPPGPTRARLEGVAARLAVRFADILLWPTRGLVTNAMVVGLVPRARYVAFTDRMLDSFDADEVDAVFGHEAGHARHGHLPYYLLFLALSAAAVGTVLAAAAAGLDAAGWTPVLPAGWGDLMLLPPLAAVGAYLFVVFGFVSRACERQADVVGARAVSCDDPRCEGHTADTRLSAGGRAVCPTGARTMARALEKVEALGGMDKITGTGPVRAWRTVKAWVRAWQHGPIPARVGFLYRLIDRPELAARHDRRAFYVRLVVAVGLLLVLVSCGTFVGWAKVWAQLGGK